MNRKVTILSLNLIIIVVICILPCVGQESILKQRVYSAEGMYYIEQEDVRRSDGEFLMSILTLYQNETSPRMLWSRELTKQFNFVFTRMDRIYISRTGRRVVLFNVDYGLDCKRTASMTILDEQGKVLRKYQNDELGFELVCTGKTDEDETIWDGVVRFSDNDKVLEIGSVSFALQAYLHNKIDLDEKCGGYFSCQDKGTPYAPQWLPDKVWHIDLATGMVLSMAKTEQIGKTLNFPSPQRYPVLSVDKGNYYSDNKQYELRISQKRDLALFDYRQMEKPLWKSKLNFMPQGEISGEITDDGKRVVLRIFPVHPYELAQSKALIFLDEKGQVIKEYELGELIDSTRVFWVSNKYFRWSSIKQITGNILYLRVFRVSDSMDELVARNIRGETIGIRDPDRLLVQDELLSFDLANGQMLDRKKIE